MTRHDLGCPVMAGGDGFCTCDDDEDVNADLIGYEFQAEDGLMWIVTGTAGWSDQYVNVERGPHKSCRPAQLLRIAKNLIPA